MTKRLLSFDDAATYLSEQTGIPELSRQWVRSQVDQGKIGCVVIAKKRRVRQDLLDVLIAKWVKAAA